MITTTATNGISSSKMSNNHPLASPDMPLRAVPPLSALLAFERAASQLSFRHAARDLALSPSAISHQILAGWRRNSASSFSSEARARCD